MVGSDLPAVLIDRQALGLEELFYPDPPLARADVPAGAEGASRRPGWPARPSARLHDLQARAAERSASLTGGTALIASRWPPPRRMRVDDDWERPRPGQPYLPGLPGQGGGARPRPDRRPDGAVDVHGVLPPA